MIGDRLLRVAHHAFVVLVVLASAIALSAQTVVDPRFVEFVPSTDHSTLATDGTPLVERYSLAVFVVGSSVAFDTMDLGKPAPSAGVIRVDFLPLLHNLPTPGVVFEARVTAVGPGGSNASTVSNGFSFQAACAPTLNSTGQSVGSGAATGSVGVTAGAGCAWSAASNASWIALTGGASGSGNGTVPYSVAANTTTSMRSGTLTIAGRTFTVTQAGVGCTFALSSSSLAVAAGGGTGTTNVTAPSGCPWSGSSNSSWITVTSGASGSGNGSLGFSVAANPSTSPRSGTLTIATRTFTVSQAAAVCTVSIAPPTMTLGAIGGSRSINISVGSGCSWTAVSNSSWLTIIGGASGTGNRALSFGVAGNTTTQSRTGTITVGGQTFTLTQSGSTCTFTLTPASRTHTGAGGTGTIAVNTTSGCAWQATTTQSWISVSGSGTASGSASYTVQPNTSSSARTGAISLGTQSFSVTQSGGSTAPAAPGGFRIVVAGGSE